MTNKKKADIINHNICRIYLWSAITVKHRTIYFIKTILQLKLGYAYFLI